MEQAKTPNVTPLWSCLLAKPDRPYYINSTAISGDGEVVIAGTFYHSYNASPSGASSSPLEDGIFGTYGFTREGKGQPLWRDVFDGYEGVYAVDVSNDGSTAASGGWYSQSPEQSLGFVRAYNASNGVQLLQGFYPPARVNAVALSSNGEVLVAGADQIYLFQMSGGGFPEQPAVYTLPDNKTGVQMVSIAGGGWFVAIDNQGVAYLIQNNGGQIGSVYQWPPTPLRGLHGIAMSANGQWFALAGFGPDDAPAVYLFSLQSMMSDQPSPVAQCTLSGDSVRDIAISDDGSIVSVAVNQAKAGSVYALQYDGSALKQLWTQPTLANPNSTSLDAAAQYVTVADGYPDDTAGHFYLFNGTTGDLLWSYQAANMNWPMFLSADASGIAAGSDSGTVYYFTT